MRKILIGLSIFIMVLTIGFWAPVKVSAAGNTVIDRVNIEVDVPVNGVSLKSTAIVHEFIDSQNMEMRNPNTATKVVDIFWYKTTEPAKVLAEGYKAKLGESYYATVVLKANSGYEIDSNIHTKNNKINGVKVSVSSGTYVSGETVWLFDTQFTTIQAASGKPNVNITSMNLTPYEGNPMEVVINVTNATNAKYQWQIVYGDDGGWSGEVDLDDNQTYGGTRTPHFKLHTYFGDTNDVDMNFAKVRCKVTSDNGTAYSKEVWFSILERTVVGNFALTGMTEPAYGDKPDFSVNSKESAKYYVSSVKWFTPEGVQMGSSSTFGEGIYHCYLIVKPTDAYKFDSSTVGTVDGIKRTFQTINGKNQYPHGPDSYRIDLYYTVEKAPDKMISQMGAVVKEPEAGKLPELATSATVGVKAVETDWSKKSSNGQFYLMNENEKFAVGNTYECAVKMKLDSGYAFAQNLTSLINGKKADYAIVQGDDYRWITYEFILEEEKIVIKDVAIYGIKEPEAGANMNDANYKKAFVSSSEPYTIDSVDWFGEDGNYADSNYFELGKKYVVRVVLLPKEGYCFDSNESRNAKINNQSAELGKIWSDGAAAFILTMEAKKESTIPVNIFTDVKEKDYFYNAVLWAVENGVTSGLTQTTFGPNNPCTRAQAVTFLWRAAGEPEPRTTVMKFKDVPKGEYYEKAVLWAVENGIAAGTSETIFSPNASCTRAQIVTFMWRAEGQTKVDAENPFTDVSSKDYFYDAVLWAVENGITAGTSETTFSPNASCTRAQIVTFLYRNATN